MSRSFDSSEGEGREDWERYEIGMAGWSKSGNEQKYGSFVRYNVVTVSVMRKNFFSFMRTGRRNIFRL